MKYMLVLLNSCLYSKTVVKKLFHFFFMNFYYTSIHMILKYNEHAIKKKQNTGHLLFELRTKSHFHHLYMKLDLNEIGFFSINRKLL